MSGSTSQGIVILFQHIKDLSKKVKKSGRGALGQMPRPVDFSDVSDDSDSGEVSSQGISICFPACTVYSLRT